MFLGVDVGLVFFNGFCLGFCSMTWRFVPENARKGSLHVRFSVLGVRSLFLCFSAVVVFCFFKRYRSGLTGTLPHTALLGLFPFCCPRRTWFIARFGRASFLSRVLSGCHSGPRAFWRFLVSLGTPF